MYACAFAISPVPTLCVTTCTFRKKDEDFDVDGGGDDEDGDEDLDGDDEDFENYDKKGQGWMVSCILEHLWQTLLPHNVLAIFADDDDHE